MLRALILSMSVFFTGNVALAAPFKVELSFGQPSLSFLVNGKSTDLSSGLNFTLLVDPATQDIWDNGDPDRTDFGLFPASEVFFSSVDLGYVNEKVVTPLAYFEDVTPQRAGISPISPNAAIQVALLSDGNSEVGNPNLLDVFPDFSGTAAGVSGSQWSQLMLIVLEDGTTIAPPASFVEFGTSSIKTTIVPLPATLPLLACGLGILGIIGWCRKRPA